MLSFCQSSFLLSTESAGKLGFGLVPSRTSRPPGKGLIARGDLGVTGSVSVTDLTSPVAVLPDDKTVGSPGTVFRYQSDVQGLGMALPAADNGVGPPVRFSCTLRKKNGRVLPTPWTALVGPLGEPDVQDSVCPSQLPATSVRSPVRFTETSKHTEEHTPHAYLNTALLFFSFLMATDLKSIPRPLPKLN